MVSALVVRRSMEVVGTASAIGGSGIYAHTVEFNLAKAIVAAGAAYIFGRGCVWVLGQCCKDGVKRKDPCCTEPYPLWRRRPLAVAAATNLIGAALLGGTVGIALLYLWQEVSLVSAVPSIFAGTALGVVTIALQSVAMHCLKIGRPFAILPQEIPPPLAPLPLPPLQQHQDDPEDDADQNNNVIIHVSVYRDEKHNPPLDESISTLEIRPETETPVL